MKQTGFTLLETLVVLAMTGILAASAYGGYGKHLHKKNEALAQKEIYNLAQKLEIHRGNNFTYAGFTTSSVTIPEATPGGSGSTGSAKYNITVVDAAGNNAALSSEAAVGRDYIIRATSTSTMAHSYLYTSKGMRCKNKASSRVTYATCGTAAQGASNW